MPKSDDDTRYEVVWDGVYSSIERIEYGGKSFAECKRELIESLQDGIEMRRDVLKRIRKLKESDIK